MTVITTKPHPTSKSVELDHFVYSKTLGPPSPPSELTATPLNETSIKLTWSVPPGVLDEELISYLVEVRNESGGLIVLSETDGTEYTFTMDNPDPCDLYSFTVTPLCGTVEGGTSAEVKRYFIGITHIAYNVMHCVAHSFEEEKYLQDKCKYPEFLNQMC